MLNELTAAGKVAGAKQVRRALNDGRAAKIFWAADADPRVTEPLTRLALEKGVPAVVTETPLDAEALQAQFAARGFKATAELQVMSGPAC